MAVMPQLRALSKLFSKQGCEGIRWNQRKCFFYKAGDRARTGNIQLGRLTLYQLSYTRNPPAGEPQSVGPQLADIYAALLSRPRAGVLRYASRRDQRRIDFITRFTSTHGHLLCGELDH